MPFKKTLFFFLCAFISVAFAASFNLATLTKAFKDKPSQEVHYTEYRYLNFSDQPVISQGTFIYRAPATFIQIQGGRKNTLTLNNTQVLITDNTGKTTPIDLSNTPLLYIPLQTFQALLQGNTALLNDDYNSQLTGTWSNWQLILIPKDQKLAQQLKSMQFEGHRQNIYRVRILQTNGNVTVWIMSNSN